jgi:hypothetical protein
LLASMTLNISTKTRHSTGQHLSTIFRANGNDNQLD